jgi:hypothetical protein
MRSLRLRTTGRRVFVGLGAAVLLAALGYVAWLWHFSLPTTVTLAPETEFQTIDGWAVFPRYWEDNKSRDSFDRSIEQYTNEVSQFLVNEVGLNAVRIEVWSGLENSTDHFLPYYQGLKGYRDYAPTRYEKVNDNDDAEQVNLAGFQFSRFDYFVEQTVLPILRAITANGEIPYINVCYVDFKWKAEDVSGSLSHAENPAEFAEFVLVFFERLRTKYGITPDAFELVLEPENTEKWRGANLGRSLIAVKQRLQRQGFSPELIGPSNTSMRNTIEYFDEMMRVPGASESLQVLAYHRYHVPMSDQLLAIRERATTHHLKTAMLEFVGADIDVLMDDLTIGNVSSWQQWGAASKAGADDKGAYYVTVDPAAPPGSRVRMAQRTTALAQVFREVRRGAVRFEATSNQGDKRVAAFRNRDDSFVVVVRARRGGGVVRVRGLPNGRYRTTFGTTDKSVVPHAVTVTDHQLETTLPSAGLLVISELH